MVLHTYKVPAIGATETQLEIEVRLDKQYSVRSAYRFMREYNLHANGTFEYLISLIAHQKLGIDINITDEIWNNLISISALYSVKKNGMNTGNMESNRVEDYYEGPEGRLKRIQKYSQEMDESWQKPIFIHSSVFNGFGVDTNVAFILDGAQRLVAGCISQKVFREATIIMASEYFGAELMNLDDINPGKLTWFPNYQKIPEIGLDGWRSNKRYEYIDMEKLRNKVVIDFGCNLGQTCIKTAIAGAEHVYGLDCQEDTLELANRIISRIGIDNISYHCIDFNHPGFGERIDDIVVGDVDFSFFLSVYRTGELLNREELLIYIIQKTNEAIFFEGHANAEIDTLDYYEQLFDRFGLDYQFKGYSEGLVRPFFVCAKHGAMSYGANNK